MEKKLFFSVICCLVFAGSSPHIFAKEKEMTGDCVQKIEDQKIRFQQKVMDDIFSTYNLPIDDENTISYNIQDLRKMSILTGTTETHMRSIYQQFESVSFGQKQLYFFNGDVNTAYILYKNPQYNNVMVKLKREEKTWEVLETQVKDGEQIKLTKENCKDEHVINKGFNGLFRGLN